MHPVARDLRALRVEDDRNISELGAATHEACMEA